MKPFGCFSRLVVCAMGAGVALGSAGCLSVFVPKHEVIVDAISAPGTIKPTNKSYRLLAKKAVVTQAHMHVPVVKACVDAALVAQGLYEAPSTVPPDLFIEVTYGTDTSSNLDPASRETFLQLSARNNPSRSLDRSAGEELWDIRVAVRGIAGHVESAMPLLCSVAANYMGTDTHAETKVAVPKNSPAVTIVRQAALQTLESGANVAGASSAAPAAPATPAVASGGDVKAKAAGGGDGPPVAAPK